MNLSRQNITALTADVFSRARAAGVGYIETSALNGSCKKKPVLVRPRRNKPWRFRITPSSRSTSVVAGFLLALAVLIVTWQIFSLPPAALPDTMQTDNPGELGSALAAADASIPPPGNNPNSSTTTGDKADTPSSSTAVSRPQLFLPGASGTELVVHVTGQVKHPGIVHLSSPARVADAIDAAGGPTDQADSSALNLARLLTDGEQIYLPAPGQIPPGTGQTERNDTNKNLSTATGANTRFVNLNTADATTLQTLPGIGPALAKRIIDYRQANGGFSSITQLDEVSGIGPALLQRVRDHVCV